MNSSDPQTPDASLQLRIARAIQPIAASQTFARMLAASIRYEATWRALLDVELQLAGIRTKGHRRRRKERADSPAGLSMRAGVRPLVNWHDGGAGPALLLLNGWTASGLVWPADWVRALEKRFRVIRVDNRGTGWSRSAPSPYSIGDLAEDANDVLRACDEDDATVLGVSMGGMIAQELALRHPRRVNRLILVGTAPPVPAQIVPDPAPFLDALASSKPGESPRARVRTSWSGYAAPGFAEAHPEIFDELADQVMQRVTPRLRIFEQLRAARSWRRSDRLRRLDVATTVIHGDRDPLMPVGNGMRLARLIPDAEYIELAGVGHLPVHEAGARLLEVLAAERQVRVSGR